MNILNALNQAVIALDLHGSTTSRLDAEVLLSSCLNMDRTSLYTHPEQMLTEKDLGEFYSRIERRKLGEPVAYIIGQKEFWSLPFKVSRHVLVPRPETEILVEEVLKVCSGREGDDLKILEIGTGCGAISVSLASEFKEARIIATDISREAITIAARNAENSGVLKRISFLIGNIYDPVSGKFDIIVSNPPYISQEEYDQLPIEVQGFEPKAALLAGVDGTEFHRELIKGATALLKPGGWLFMEIGSGQKNKVEFVLKESNLYDTIIFRTDYAGFDRVAIARRGMKNG